MENISNQCFIGVDYGTINSSIGIYINGKFAIIKNLDEGKIISSTLIFKNNVCLNDGKNINKENENYNNIIYEYKRIIGLSYKELNEKEFFKYLTYEIIEKDNMPLIKINDNGKDKLYSAQDISSLLFKNIKKEIDNYIYKLGENNILIKVLITVPKYFNDQQKKEINSAAKSAGFESPNIIDEPFAEIIGYSFGLNLISEYSKNENSINDKKSISNISKNVLKNLLVFDLGGSKNDITLLKIIMNNEGDIEVKTEITVTDNNLGGIDFDNLLINHCLKIFCKEHGYEEEVIRKNKKGLLNLKLKCEETRIKLNKTNVEDIIIKNFFNNNDLNIKIHKEEFDIICKDLYLRISKLINDNFNKDKTLDEKDEIILIGRASKMFGIKNLIIKLFNKNKIRDNLNLDDIFPYCTTIKAIKSEEKDSINLNLNFGVMNNLGVSKNKTFNNIGESKASFDRIIKRYTKIPVSGLSINKDYTINLNEKCKDILIEIYEGKGKDLIKYKKIGEIILTGIKKTGIITYNV